MIRNRTVREMGSIILNKGWFIIRTSNRSITVTLLLTVI